MSLSTVSSRKYIKGGGGAKFSHEEYVGSKSKTLQIIAYAVMLLYKASLYIIYDGKSCIASIVST